MGQKGHIMVQKGLKMHEKSEKAEFSLAELGGTPLPPLNGKSSCPKTLSGIRGYFSNKPIAEMGVHPPPP